MRRMMRWMLVALLAVSVLAGPAAEARTLFTSPWKCTFIPGVGVICVYVPGPCTAPPGTYCR